MSSVFYIDLQGSEWSILHRDGQVYAYNDTKYPEYSLVGPFRDDQHAHAEMRRLDDSQLPRRSTPAHVRALEPGHVLARSGDLNASCAIRGSDYASVYLEHAPARAPHHLRSELLTTREGLDLLWIAIGQARAMADEAAAEARQEDRS